MVSAKTSGDLEQTSEAYLLEIRELKQTVAELRAEIERMRKRATNAMSRYGKHADRCGLYTTISGECSCGYEDQYRLLYVSDQAQRGQA